MKLFFDKIITIVMIVFMLSMCKMCTSNYIKGGDNKAIANYKKMIFDKSTATAEYYPDYKVTSVKVMKLPIKTYTFRYHFNVNNENFENERTLNELPTTNTFTLFYLKEDPNFNSVSPKKDLENEKSKNSSNSDLYWGIGWGFFGIIASITTISEFYRRKKE
jgi:hypothetical protein